MSRFARPVLPKLQSTTSEPEVEILPALPSASPATISRMPASPWLSFECQKLEISLSGDKSQLKGERFVFAEGLLTHESFSAEADEQLFYDVADQWQAQMAQQMETMFKLMFMPWQALPGFSALLPKSIFGK